MAESHHEPGAKSSGRRILTVLVIMVGVAALSFLPALFSRNGTGTTSTATNYTPLFFPVWISLTVGVVFICFYFFQDLVTAERYRDRESPERHPAH